MKKIIVLVMTLLVGVAVFSQTKEQYLEKSRKKKTAAIIFLSAGAAFTVGGTILLVDGVNRHHHSDDYYGNIYGDEGTSEAVVGALGMVVGIAGMSTSIPFFIGAHKSKQKALAITFKSETMPLAYKTALTSRLYPALSFKINLGR